MAVIRNYKIEPHAGRDSCRAENLQVNRAAKLQVARIAALPRIISQLKRVSFSCVITLRAHRALFFPNGGDICLHAGNQILHAPLMLASRTVPTDADAHVGDLYTGRETIFNRSATVKNFSNSLRVLAISSPLTRPVSNQ